MGNMQFNLDKSYDSLPIKDANDAQEIVKMIKAAEDLVSNYNIFFNFFVLRYLVSNQPG